MCHWDHPSWFVLYLGKLCNWHDCNSLQRCTHAVCIANTPLLKLKFQLWDASLFFFGPTQFTFYAGVDYDSSNLRAIQMDELSASVMCSNSHTCSAFNSEGFLKDVTNPALFVFNARYTTPCDGIFVKNGGTSLYFTFFSTYFLRRHWWWMAHQVEVCIFGTTLLTVIPMYKIQLCHRQGVDCMLKSKSGVWERSQPLTPFLFLILFFYR